MDHYFKKQLFIGLVFVLIVVVIGGGIYLIIRNSQKNNLPNGDQNPEEKKPVEILSDKFIPTTENNYDLVARAKNPNSDFGVESVGYVFEIYDSNNQLIVSKEGKTYILPQEAKYIIEQKFFSEKIPAKLEFRLKDVSWIKLKEFSELELRIKNRNLQLTEEGFNRISGAIENRSNYDLDKIEVVGLLLDEGGEIIGVGKTEMRTVLRNESRGFEIIWSYQVSIPISSFDVRIYTNVFSSENFLKAHGTPEQEEE